MENTVNALIWSTTGDYVSGTRYNRGKEAARQKAIEWQYNAETQDYSYGELADWAAYFERLGRRYGLLREFRENAIC